MPLTPEDVQNKRFAVTRFRPGYDEDEVDAFLDEVEAELTRLLGENTRLRAQPGQAPAAAPAAAAPVPVAPPTPAPVAGEAEGGQEAALRTLLLAQRTADEAITQARKEAEQLLADARTRVSAMEHEAREQHATTSAELDRKRRELERQVEDLRAFEREYRTRLRAYLETQLRELEGRGSAGAPATDAATPTPSERPTGGSAGSAPGGAAGGSPTGPAGGTPGGSARPTAGGAAPPGSRGAGSASAAGSGGGPFAPPAFPRPAAGTPPNAAGAPARETEPDSIEVDEGPEVPPSAPAG